MTNTQINENLALSEEDVYTALDALVTDETFTAREVYEVLEGIVNTCNATLDVLKDEILDRA